MPRKVRWPDLSIEQLLAWADAHHERTGEWPTKQHPGWVVDAPAEHWARLDACLRMGLRSLPAGLSLARLLAKHRGVRNRKALPHLTEDDILAWADAHQQRTGAWPKSDSGPVAAAPGETWTAVDIALHRGTRGLSPGSSLAQLFAARRAVRNRAVPPRLAVKEILAWVDAHVQEFGQWPQSDTGPIPGTLGETWTAVDKALRRGRRGLPGGSSLARLLAAERGVTNRLDQPRLSERRILAWADAHYTRTGQYPTTGSGPVADAPDETWAKLNAALRDGRRSLSGGIGLAALLLRERAVRNAHLQPALSEEQILQWADAFFARHGYWPARSAGPVADAPGEEWRRIDQALRAGNRGLAGGSSLCNLLALRRGAPRPEPRPPLIPAGILEWADEHFARTGRWPRAVDGPVEGAPEESWSAIDRALREGRRGLPGLGSLAQLLAEERGAPVRRRPGDHSIADILQWADWHHARERKWPNRVSGPVLDAEGETWPAIDQALRHGHRGLPGGSSLAGLLREEGRKRKRQTRPELRVSQILAWADAHYIRHGRWPNNKTGPVADASGETWAAIDVALHYGLRGLPSGLSVPRLIKQHRPAARGE